MPRNTRKADKDWTFTIPAGPIRNTIGQIAAKRKITRQEIALAALDDWISGCGKLFLEEEDDDALEPEFPSEIARLTAEVGHC